MRRHVKQRFDRQDPSGVAWRSQGQGLIDERRGHVVLVREHERNGTCDGRINGHGVIRLNLDAAVRGAESRQSQTRKRMLGNTFNRLLKGGRRRLAIAVAKPQCPDRVPRVRAALATVEMAALLECELAFEGLERRLLFVALKMNQAAQSMERDGTEP